MSSRRGGLGRGLDALLGTASAEKPSPNREGELSRLPLDMLQPGRYQPRLDMRKESLGELAESIKAQGMVQPIVVRRLPTDRYEIIAGERRWRAAQLAGVAEVPVLIREVADDGAIAIALIENIQREDLNPLEEAVALKRLLAEFELTHQEAADAVGRSRAAVSNLLRLLELASPVQELVRERRLEMGHARALLALEPPRQHKAAQLVVSKGLSVRETETLVRRLSRRASDAPAKSSRDPDVQRLETELAERLGARVVLQHSRSGKGTLVIHYTSLDELDGILAHVK